MVMVSFEAEGCLRRAGLRSMAGFRGMMRAWRMAGEGHIGEEGSKRGLLGRVVGAMVVLLERRLGDALGTEVCGLAGGRREEKWVAWRAARSLIDKLIQHRVCFPEAVSFNTLIASLSLGAGPFDRSTTLLDPLNFYTD